MIDNPRGFTMTDPMKDPKIRFWMDVSHAVDDGKADELRALFADRTWDDYLKLGFVKNGDTLNEAAGRGKLDVVKALVELGENPNRRRDGLLPIYYAAQSGHRAVVAFLKPLTKSKKDVALAEETLQGTEKWSKKPESERDRFGEVWTLIEQGNAKKLHKLMQKKKATWKDVLRDLGEAGEPGAALCDAADEGNLEMVKVLLELGDDPNGRDDEGYYPIQIAADEGHRDIVELLKPLTKSKKAITYAERTLPKRRK